MGFRGPQHCRPSEGEDAEPQCLWVGEGGNDSDDRYLLPLAGRACAQEPCQGEEAVCLSRNAGSEGEVSQAFQRGRGHSVRV